MLSTQRQTGTRSILALALAGLAALTAAGTEASADTCYKVTDLGALGFSPNSADVFGINNAGEAVFTAVVAGKKHAMLYLPADAYGLLAGCHDLHVLADTQLNQAEISLAHDLNDAGVVVGQATVGDDNLAFVWDLGDVLDNDDQYFDLGTLPLPPVELPFSEAWAINDEDPPIVVGDSHVRADCFCPDDNIPGNDQCVIRGFIVTLAGNDPVLAELTPVEAGGACDTNSGARDLNTPFGPLDGAEVAGFSHTRPACLCTNENATSCELDLDAMWWLLAGVPVRLSDLSDGGSEGRGNNDNDEIVGWGFASSVPQCLRRALFWEGPADLTPTILDTEPAGQRARAEAINNLADPQVVGWNEDTEDAILWVFEGGFAGWDYINLNDTIQPCSTSWSLVQAYDLTDAAAPSIVGWGLRSGVRHGFLLTPDPDCCPVDLNGDGTVGAVDLLILLASWGPCPDCGECGVECIADLDCDCSVGALDLLILLTAWGPCGESGGGPPQDILDCLDSFCCDPEDMLALEKCICLVDPECDPSP